jgi:hypothetical protein
MALFKSFKSRDAIADRLHAGALVERTANLLWLGVRRMSTAAAATGAALNAKFAADGDAFKGEMGFGGLEQFYGGAPLPHAPPRRAKALVVALLCAYLAVFANRPLPAPLVVLAAARMP